MLMCESLRPTNPQGFLKSVEDILMSKGLVPNGDSDNSGGTVLYVFDTETTGVSARDCIVEIGCVEMRDGKLTGRNFIRTCKPYAPMHPAAAKVHGLTEESLTDAMSVEEALVDFLHYVEDGARSVSLPRQSADVAVIVDGSATTATAAGEKEEFCVESVEKQMASFSITNASKNKWEEKERERLQGGLEASLNANTWSSDVSDALSRSLASPASEAPIFNEGPTAAAAEDQKKKQRPTNNLCRIAFAGHNVAFDMRMLANCAKHLGLDQKNSKEDSDNEGKPHAKNGGKLGSTGKPLSPSSLLNPFVPSDYETLCTMKLFKQMYPGQSSNTLDSCCDFFGIERNLSAAERAAIGDYRLKTNVRQHSALTDAYATGLLLEKMLEAARQNVHA